MIDSYELEGLEWIGIVLYDGGELDPTYLVDINDRGRDRDNRRFYDDWTTELDQSGYNGDFEQWINGPGLGFSHDQEKAREQWELAWGKAHRARESQLTRRQHNIDINNKLSFFTAPFVAIEDAYSVYTIYATMGIGSLPNRSFNYTMRYQGLKSKLIDKLYLARDPAYFAQDGVHRLWSRSAYRQIINDGKMSWRPGNRTYGFKYEGQLGRYELGVRPDGGIVHNNFFKYPFEVKPLVQYWWR